MHAVRDSPGLSRKSMHAIRDSLFFFWEIHAIRDFLSFFLRVRACDTRFPQFWGQIHACNTKFPRFFLGCQIWQSCVADHFCYCWNVFSKRTLLTKSVVWKAAQQPRPSHQQHPIHCRCISAWEPRPCPEGSQKVSQNPCSEDASKNKPSSQARKARRALEAPNPT